MIDQALINPRSIAVIGASNDIAKVGGRILYNIIQGGYKGNLYVVNPKTSEVQGIKCVKKIDDLPTVDLVILAIPPNFIKDNIEFLTKNKQAKAFIVLTGLSENEGKEVEKEITEIINKNKATLLGPNCIGCKTPKYHGMFAGPMFNFNPQGIDIASGSGGVAVFLIEKGLTTGLSFASVFNVGNCAQICIEDILKYWDENYDPINSSKIKLLYMEEIKKPDLFLIHAKSLIKKGCKIAAIKAGSTESGSRAASLHSGAIANPDSAVDALFKKAGIIRCYGREELIYTAGILVHPELKGKKLAIITHAGGPGIILTDTLAKGEIPVPQLKGKKSAELLSKLYPGSLIQNPIDFLATGNAKQLEIIIDYVENEFTLINGMIVIFGSPGLFDISEVYETLHNKMKTCRKPIFPILPSIITAQKELKFFKSLGRSYFLDEASFGKALINILNTPQFKTKGQLPPIKKGPILSTIKKVKQGFLPPEDVKILLNSAQIPTIPEKIVQNKTQAVKIAKEFGYPIAMKIIGPLHRTELNGVVLNITTDQVVEKEFDRLMKIPGTKSIVIQPMLEGIELFVGAKYQPPFGHVILCGFGGILIELFKDTQAGLAPVFKSEAAYMIRSLKGYNLLQGFRGKKKVNKDLFVEIICKLSALIKTVPQILEIDLNPLIAFDNKIISVDAKIKISS